MGKRKETWNAEDYVRFIEERGAIEPGFRRATWEGCISTIVLLVLAAVGLVVLTRWGDILMFICR